MQCLLDGYECAVGVERGRREMPLCLLNFLYQSTLQFMSNSDRRIVLLWSTFLQFEFKTLADCSRQRGALKFNLRGLKRILFFFYLFPFSFFFFSFYFFISRKVIKVGFAVSLVVSAATAGEGTEPDEGRKRGKGAQSRDSIYPPFPPVAERRNTNG